MLREEKRWRKGEVLVEFLFGFKYLFYNLYDFIWILRLFCESVIVLIDKWGLVWIRNMFKVIELLIDEEGVY